MEGIVIPSKWNTWKVIELIGEGACSEVYHVRDRISGRDAALKVVTIEKTALSQEGFIVDVGLEAMVQSMAPMDDKLFRKKIEKTENEIELLQSLKGHENIVTLYDYEIVVEEDVATVYILMEYLQDLWAWIFLFRRGLLFIWHRKVLPGRDIQSSLRFTRWDLYCIS